ncbi:hypothetical protein FEM48_Zijuj01G0036500 [Ziziphus jujuba var. spinosa]|uniref:Negative regulator of systemic acquired resistance SNI1-like n=1 Tax=Ziziphus jujuba var. spinosa TaxID=714518 RepID=A0A978VYY1_ZIZJJ|nr:hypothetical protein FEM48_Zijuj01G0036500 [Ziziphus jujuba var. spinosa]
MAICDRRKTINRGALEENILAIIDASEAKDSQDAHDDHQLESTNKHMTELVVVKEAWSPFIFSLEIASSEREAAKDAGGPLDSSGFLILIQYLADVADENTFQSCDTKSLGKMLLFQYLVNFLEGDFIPRKSMYEESTNWILLRESLLNMLLVSRKINFKSLMKDCLTIMCKLYQICIGFSDDLVCPDNSVAKSTKKCDVAVEIAFLEVGKNTSIAVRKLLNMIMELDTCKNKADAQGCTTRADGVRTPLVEIILDELTYNNDILQPFLQVFDDPKLKLEVVEQYFWKYISKPSVRTRRSNGSADDTTFIGALKCFSNVTSTRSIIKKIGTEEAQLLLVHGFQAYLSLPSRQYPDEDDSHGNQESRSSSVIDICKNMISAFKSLRTAAEHMEILLCSKEALFMAATVLSVKS